MAYLQIEAVPKKISVAVLPICNDISADSKTFGDNELRLCLVDSVHKAVSALLRIF